MSVGVVVIGRNEGDRLRTCLKSVLGRAVGVVYVDSGSSDASVATARTLACQVVELDMSRPFCAARARNAGFEYLIQQWPDVTSVQFIDGDCEIVEGWLSAAADALAADAELAVVTGWLHERSPEASIYNRLGDLEWNFAGAGEVEWVGGLFMIRRCAFEAVGGFDATIAAGEEPELCQRLIRQGWRLQRLNRDMALHDLAVTRFVQWWKRVVRFGYGSMDVAVRFGLPRFLRSNLRGRFWAAWLLAVLACLPLLVAFRAPAGMIWPVIALAALWPIQCGRIAVRTWRKGCAPSLALTYAFFMMVANWPHVVGQMLYWSDRLQRRSWRLVEYKTAAPVVASGDVRPNKAGGGA